MNLIRHFHPVRFGCACLATAAISLLLSVAHAAETRAPVIFFEGYDTDARDHGRPVVLIAAGLGVSTNVFREAFSGVTPAQRDGGPTEEEARRNKYALLKKLAPHGVTNDRLDEVSNYYRYRPQNGELWKNVPAQAEAVIEDGVVKRIEVTKSGAGYSTPPRATIKGLEKINLKVTLHFDKDLAKNGSIAKIEMR